MYELCNIGFIVTILRESFLFDFGGECDDRMSWGTGRAVNIGKK